MYDLKTRMNECVLQHKGHMGILPAKAYAKRTVLMREVQDIKAGVYYTARSDDSFEKLCGVILYMLETA